MNDYELASSLQKISTWGKVVGILMMIGGGLSALSGLVFFVIGAVPGLIIVWLGYLLFKISKDADVLKHQYDAFAQTSLYKNLGTFLQVQGILAIISIIFTLIVLLLVLLGAVAFGSFIQQYPF